MQKQLNIDITIKSKKWLKIPEIKNFINNQILEITKFSPLKKFYKNVEFDIGITLCSNSQIQKINLKYRKIDKPTDVLSFGNLNEKIIKKHNLKKAIGNNKYFFLGDILLGYEYIYKHAKSNNLKLQDHISHLLTHGFLHLIGYDHEIKKEQEIMRKLEIKILKKLHIKNPYLKK